MTLTLEKKGPAAIAVAPSHGSQSPKGHPNMKTVTTPESRHARDAAVASAMRDLESDICDALNMALILHELFSENIVEYRNGKRVAMPEPGGTLTVVLGYQQIELLSFASNDVIDRCSRLKKRWTAAVDAGGAA